MTWGISKPFHKQGVARMSCLQVLRAEPTRLLLVKVVKLCALCDGFPVVHAGTPSLNFHLRTKKEQSNCGWHEEALLQGKKLGALCEVQR